MNLRTNVKNYTLTDEELEKVYELYQRDKTLKNKNSVDEESVIRPLIGYLGEMTFYKYMMEENLSFYWNTLDSDSNVYHYDFSLNDNFTIDTKTKMRACPVKSTYNWSIKKDVASNPAHIYIMLNVYFPLKLPTTEEPTLTEIKSNRPIIELIGWDYWENVKKNKEETHNDNNFELKGNPYQGEYQNLQPMSTFLLKNIKHMSFRKKKKRRKKIT